MKKKSLFKRVSGVLTGVFFSTSLILAANENGQLFGSETLIVVVALLLLFVPLFLYVRKLHSNMNDRSDRIIKENAALESLNKEISSRNEEVNTRNEELDSRNKSLEGQIEQQEERYRVLREQNDDLAKANSDLVRKNNELELVISTLNNNKKELEQLIVTKIKENDMIQREAADKLAEAEKRLKDAESINDNFFIETIHEMRTPLSLVLGSLALVVQNDDPEKDMSTQLLSAYRNTLAMQDLADQLIGTHRSNDVANYLRIARYDMVEIARQICDIFVDWVAMNNIDFRINTQTPALWVWMDRRKMEFALRMLLSNAFKNTFVYGKVTLDISVVNENGKAYSTLVVTDEGLDEDESTRRGLKQIMEMADAIGGMYRSESDKNGTSYIIMIPLGKQHLLDRRVEFVEPESDLVKLNARQKEEIAELIHVIPQKKETGKKLLVIDDSDQIRWFLKHVFNKEYQILEARNGQDGINVALKEEPDLILCDVMMPVKDGYETCREIKNDPKMAQTPVVMLTAKVESEDVITGIEAGADDYITKPFDVEILRSKINSLMKKRDDMKRYFSNSSAASHNEENTLSTNPFMDAVVKNIEKHLDDSTFEAKVLADSYSMSLPTLYRKIKQYSDLSILELTRNIRLKKAAELLASQQYSVQEVAEMVGFNDTATFRKRFTEQYGVTPSQYLHIDTFNIFYARIIVEQKKTFYFCTKIMDRDSDEAYRFQIKVL
jgi:two-component system, sensor histidine kinase ChiS